MAAPIEGYFRFRLLDFGYFIVNLYEYRYSIKKPKLPNSNLFTKLAAMEDEALMRSHCKVVRFLMESGEKLNMKTVTLASAAHIYHQFFSRVKLQDYDPYLIGTSSIYLAGKVEEDHLRLRDVINVCHRTLHKDKAPLDMGSGYWDLRDAVVQCELFILRVLSFQVLFVHPHNYMLHYLKSLVDWFDPHTLKQALIVPTAWAILNDSYHGNTCLKYSAEAIAVACIYLAMESLGVEVPYNNQARTPWWEVFDEELSIKRVRDIVKDIIRTYHLENTT